MVRRRSRHLPGVVMLKRMKMETRLHLGLGSIVVLVVLLGLTAFANLTALHDSWTQFETVTLVRKDAMLSAVIAEGSAVHHFKNYVLRGSPNTSRNSAPTWPPLTRPSAPTRPPARCRMRSRRSSTRSWSAPRPTATA